MASGRRLVGRQDASAEFDAEQPYTFVGFVTLTGEPWDGELIIVDRAGRPVATLRPGDSFVGPPEAFGG